MIASVADLVKLHEGLRLTVYTDTRGHPTIGYGRALDTHGISGTEAEYLLANDLEVAAHQTAGVVGDAVWDTLSDPRKAALIDMAFNMGAARLSGFHNTLTAIAVGDWQAAHDQAMQSAWALQVGERAKRDAQMLLTGNWPDA